MQKKTARGNKLSLTLMLRTGIPFLSVSDTAHHFQPQGQTLNPFKQYWKPAKPVPTGYCGVFPMWVSACVCMCVHVREGEREGWRERLLRKCFHFSSIFCYSVYSKVPLCFQSTGALEISHFIISSRRSSNPLANQFAYLTLFCTSLAQLLFFFAGPFEVYAAMEGR